MKSFSNSGSAQKWSGNWSVYFLWFSGENDDTNETTEQESSFQANAQTELEKSGLHYPITVIMAFISTRYSTLF